MRVVVTGGTGFVGKALAHALVGRGDDVVVLTRGASRRPDHACAECKNGGNVELVNWTPEAAGEWQRTIDGADAVVHLAGAPVLEGRWSKGRKDVLVSSRVRSTELVADAIARATTKPKVLVSASAVGYYGTTTEGRTLDESASPGTDFLAQLTREWESAASRAGIRTVFPRIGIVLGRGGGPLSRLLPLFRAFVGGPVGAGTQYVAWIHLRDVVRALEHVIARPEAEGAFNVTSPEPVTMNAFADALATALGRPAAVRVPAFAVRLALGEAAEAVLTGQRAVPKRLVESGFAFVFPELASALADLV